MADTQKKSHQQHPLERTSTGHLVVFEKKLHDIVKQARAEAQQKKDELDKLRIAEVQSSIHDL